MTTVQLHPGGTHRVLAGHCWVYDNEIGKVTGSPADGGVVKLLDPRGRFLGVGFYNSQSQIRVRLLSRHSDEINADFLRTRLAAAWAYRQRLGLDKHCCRVVSSEADLLPGLIVDKYGDVLVLQTLTLGMDQRKADLAALLRELLRPRAILERNDAPIRKHEGLPPASGILHGECDGHVAVEFSGLKFELNLLEGHKTGFYLDQQLNYARVAAVAAGKRVLDAFSYMGAFTLFCAKAGAARVLGIEIDADNVAAAQANAVANGLADRVEFRAQNAFDFLTAAAKAAETYDLIVLDPPSFTRTRANVGEAARGYKEIHVRALKMLGPGGVLATFCCSHHVTREMFEQLIAEAAGDTRRDVRLLERLSQSPDHPILPAVPETEYLKGAILQVM
ncbi:MAG: class I SAM-dependent rRNA methyltransferase [Verrucomicrobia bacterium]|nr:class I SAM-dependent rRNA methyltransferase [Verrucomicrobiota bacterium]